MKLDLLAFGAHPDDVELSCAGTLLNHIAIGRKAGIADLTRGELGTRGTPEIREQEAIAASQILGVQVRENLEMRDGFFLNDETNQLKVIRLIRRYQPDVVLANAIRDRHPDHARGAALVRDACFLAGLSKIETKDEGHSQSAWRPRVIYNYTQDRWIEPDIIIDISNVWEKKMASIRAFSSQFFDPNSKEPDTYISTPDFLQALQSRAQTVGRLIGAQYGEAFTTERKTGIDNFFVLR